VIRDTGEGIRPTGSSACSGLQPGGLLHTRRFGGTGLGLASAAAWPAARGDIELLTHFAARLLLPLSFRRCRAPRRRTAACRSIPRARRWRWRPAGARVDDKKPTAVILGSQLKLWAWLPHVRCTRRRRLNTPNHGGIEVALLT